jgi:hypothetical protein
MRAHACLLAAWLISTLTVPMTLAQQLKAGAAAAQFEANDSLVIGGGILAAKAAGQEGELRASAVVIQAEDGTKACLVACDVLMINRDILDTAAHAIEAQTGIPFDAILINCTHTHHAPTTCTIHGYSREEAFTKHVGEKIVEAAVFANSKLTPVECRFRMGEESSVGRNSRLYLGDGTIYWTGSREDAVRPTGPFDAQLPVLAFRKPDGKYEAVLFNHSTHTIGAKTPGKRSPSFYGLAAQELETEKGGTFLFFEGASGSTHNLDLTAQEMVFRIKSAVEKALSQSQTLPISTIRAARRALTVRVRNFDEAKDDAAVSSYCRKRVGGAAAEQIIEVFRKQRAVLAAQRGGARETWIQAIVLGEVAFVGVPAEFFTVLGQEIKARSPYRHTVVAELANDYIGYVPDAEAYTLGGYQTWTGLHSFVEPGTGEKIVDECVTLLRSLHENGSGR